MKSILVNGIPVTINTDNRTVSNTTMTDEVRKVMEEFELTEQQYYQIYEYSVEGAFASKEAKQYLRGFLPA